MLLLFYALPPTTAYIAPPLAETVFVVNDEDEELTALLAYFEYYEQGVSYG